MLKQLAMVTGLAIFASACVAEVEPYEEPGAEDLPPPGSEAALSNNERTAFNYFVAKGLTPEQSAGIVGNLMQESNVRPTAVELGGGPGRGIAQWSVGGRWDTDPINMRSFANARGSNRWALNTQLDFIWHELERVPSFGLAQLRAATTVSQAIIVFQNRYERCGTCAQGKRLQYANEVLRAYGSGGTTPAPGGDDGATCNSATLGREVPENTCVQARSDGEWYQCSEGLWVDRWSDPDPCVSEHPL